jgi:hypothetical protein
MNVHAYACPPLIARPTMRFDVCAADTRSRNRRAYAFAAVAPRRDIADD